MQVDTCKEIVKDAPIILDYICDECKDHFEALKSYLDVLDIKYKVDPFIVRGLDYYSKTVFEFIIDDITICAGGRYDYLIEEIGGPSMPAVGFGMGIERLLLTLQEKAIEIPEEAYVDLYLGNMGDKAKLEVLKLAKELRDRHIKCEIDHMGKSVKAQMKYANRIGAKYSMVLGEEELNTGKVSLKRMEDGQQIEVDIKEIDTLIKVFK